MASLVTCSTLGRRGRLGNQCFQIAATLAFAKRTDRMAVFKDWTCDRDRIRFADYFKHPLNYSSSIRINSLYEEPAFHYTAIPNQFGNVDLFGYFQSDKYFAEAEELVRYHFTPCETLLQSIRHRWHNIKWQETASIHVRRSDYLNTPALYPICSSDYYRASIELTKGAYGVKQFLVFGDDIWWMKQQFKGNEFVFSYKNSSISDLFAMSLCSHNIIANSSFSWWASYLNNNPEKVVIAPKQWIFGEDQKDVYRKEMIVM
jgi:hypothetical protein